MLYGRQLREFLPKSRYQLIGKPRTLLAAKRESALAVRGAKLKERLSERKKAFTDLNMGDYVVIQN